MALDAKVRLKEARKLRYSAFDAKRKAMVDDLEERERQFKKARAEKEQHQNEVWRENEKIMDQGRRLREQKEKELLQREEEARKLANAAQEDEEPPAIGNIHYDLSPYFSLLTRSRPTGYNSTTKILAIIASKPHHIRSLNKFVTPFRRNRYRICRSFHQI
jgi:DnaJ homolog subfamily C member 17